MNKWQANVRITLKPVVNDPPGLAIRDALHHLGYAGVRSVRSGKYIQVFLEAQDQQSAAAMVDDMCRRLLSNPVIEDYTFDVVQVEAFPTAEE
jgi:phosphoribosylformylglycinamidine synthase PurS subunit